MFGLVPQDFNLGRETENLLGEQAAAFYDYKKKRLYIIDSTPPAKSSRWRWSMNWPTPSPISSTLSAST